MKEHYLWHKNLMQVGLCFEQKNQSNIYCEQADSLSNTLAYIMIFILIHVYI